MITQFYTYYWFPNTDNKFSKTGPQFTWGTTEQFTIWIQRWHAGTASHEFVAHEIR